MVDSPPSFLFFVLGKRLLKTLVFLPINIRPECNVGSIVTRNGFNKTFADCVTPEDVGRSIRRFPTRHLIPTNVIRFFANCDSASVDPNDSVFASTVSKTIIAAR